jgi:hypothetical protein|tara:strand:- start:868 stop:1701 length:834 start_codon:yes stop_codon:yes gene_type:complete
MDQKTNKLAELKEAAEYFDAYIGKKDHAKSLSFWYPNIHETRLRLNYTYYNSKETMERIFNWYLKIDPDGRVFDYTVIDDGSQEIPITECNVPDHWTVLRIDKDHGWNNEGARNCLMRDTSNKWNLLMDSDWLITKRCLDRITRELLWLDDEFVYFPGNFGPKVGRNSYLVSKAEFWKRGGYDQAFVGYHGVDYSFLRYNKKYDYSELFWFTRLQDDVIDPKDKDRMNNVKKFHKHMEEYETLGYGYRNKEDKQDFVWTNLDKKQELWLQIDYERTQ